MTREEAIKILKAIRVYECYPKSASEETKEALDMAIEALSAEAVQGEWIDEDGNNVPLQKYGYTLKSCYCNQCHEWLVGSDEYSTKGNFCPNCGARMKGANDE